MSTVSICRHAASPSTGNSTTPRDAQALMRFDVVTLFPELFAPHLRHGITRRAFETGLVDVRLWQLRDFADDTYRRVDDRPYGGGPGMVMLAEPLQRALQAVAADRAEAKPAVVHFTPTGRRLNQALVEDFARGPGAVLLCGRYEGIDQRLLDAHVTHHVSLGDFVLSGGELPALALLDAVARLQEGVLTAPSHQQDSFSDGLLEGPHYSRPEKWLLDGAEHPVPAVLLSGHHADIARWRRERSLEATARSRPDLIAAARAAGRLTAADERYLAGLGL
jgi:tRNA (guanine37-N1)-methyltransferase